MSLILTLHLDPESQRHFEALRQQYFPPERNQVPAHLTLFHTLPDTEGTTEAIHQAAHAQRRFAAEVTGVRFLGKGVALALASPELLQLHRELATRFKEHLSAQDRQRLMPHIVVQNKTTAEEARALFAKLQRDFQPRAVESLGLDLWEYLGGPWRHLLTCPFSA